MFSVPYSRTIFGLIPWYSFLIVIGAAIAIFLASREEKRTSLPKDTVLDFSLIVLPCGIIGARIYYVIFSWDLFRNDFLSVFKIWEGGIAIYGAVIAGLLTAVIFCKKRKISFLTLCDLIAPGLILAQAIGRWGNYFNQEAYGLPVSNPQLCFFPFAVQISDADSLHWHMATFFYESLWNMLVFVFLIIARRKWFRYKGDIILFYAFLYACGRLIVEDFRMDSLYASSSVRVSQLLSVVICIFVLLYYLHSFRNSKVFNPLPKWILAGITLSVNCFLVIWLTGLIHFDGLTVFHRFLVLASASVVNIVSLLILYGKCAEGDILYADNKN
ncbi:MAG: prolipoprotein diacylglyceryl transferase [Clostridia bacterium]|nr:prolipoprotein diacylglyceryl transferase [Clostridia bacterium]